MLVLLLLADIVHDRMDAGLVVVLVDLTIKSDRLLHRFDRNHGLLCDGGLKGFINLRVMFAIAVAGVGDVSVCGAVGS